MLVFFPLPLTNLSPPIHFTLHERLKPKTEEIARLTYSVMHWVETVFITSE